jgi:hypothetical protein
VPQTFWAAQNSLGWAAANRAATGCKNSSIIPLTWSGTKSWMKWQEPTVRPSYESDRAQCRVLRSSHGRDEAMKREAPLPSSPPRGCRGILVDVYAAALLKCQDLGRGISNSAEMTVGRCARERFAASLLKPVAKVDDAADKSVLVD